MTIVAAILYFLGIFLYYIHQLSALHLSGNEDYSERQAIFNAIVWPVRTIEHIVMFLTFSGDDDEQE